MIVGISMVRDEADIIETTVRNMMSQVDHVIVSDNGSVDGTLDILRSLDVEVVEDKERGYYQSQKMTALAQMAGDQGATWVVPFDADEMWYSPFGRIADVLSPLAGQWLTASARLYDHVSTNIDSDDPNPVTRMGWRRRNAAPLPKVACRVRKDLVIHQGNHGASYDGGATDRAGQLVVRHFPYRSPDQFVRKARNGAEAYAATDLPEDVGAHWRGYGRILETEGEDALKNVFYTWFWVAEPANDRNLTFDPCPL